MGAVCAKSIKYWHQLGNIPRETVKRNKGNNGGRQKRVYIDCVCSFDIETTRLREQNGDGKYDSVMYHWQFQLGTKCTYVGRTWEEYKEFVNNLTKYYDSEYIVVYIHNISFEFQFMKAIFEIEDVLATGDRHVISFRTPHVEYRCGYRLSGYSLDVWSRQLNVYHSKLSGEKFNYDKIRYSYTSVTVHEMMYMVNDVRAEVECVLTIMEAANDNLYTIPLTATGYVRRDVKKALRESPKYYLEALKPEPEVHHLFVEAMRGGNTHAGRMYAGNIMCKIKSKDEESAYPFELLTSEFPTQPFKRELDKTYKRVKELYKRHRSFILKIFIRGIALRQESVGCPYISIAKCTKLGEATNDNGRVLKAEFLVITVTDVDWIIIISQYKIKEIKILELYSSNYRCLPVKVRDVILKYYQDKTALKGVEGREVEYMVSKKKLNSCYGMAAQKPLRDIYKYENGVIVNKGEQSWEEAKPTMPYQWGVWCTAWARYHLEEGICASGEGFIYADTDSVKYIPTPSSEKEFERINCERRDKSCAHSATAIDSKNVRHYMGIFDDEPEYEEFITWGSKKYAGAVNGEITLTVAGVNKKKGAAELKRKGGLGCFKPGLIFEESGGAEAHYNDYGDKQIPYKTKDGETIIITSNVSIIPHEYTLGITKTYAEILYEYNQPSMRLLIDSHI